MSNFLLSRARLFLPVLLILFSQAVFALGLGNIKVESFLNQPLNARIDLLVRPGEDISGITARLASAEDYALIGASRDSISVPLRFAVDTQGDQPFIRVTSNLPINDPVVRLIIELNWASGRLLREYTLFLDPPTVPMQAPPPVIDQRRQAPVEPAAEPQPAADPVEPGLVEQAVESDAATAQTTSSAPATIPASASADSTPVPVSAEGEYGPVQSGDTLWRIASNWSDGSGANLNQVMLAIQRNNPQAFINNNINLLRRGAILRMPSSADIAAISASAARDEVLEQAEIFSGTSAASPRPHSIAPAVETPLVDVASEMSSASSANEPDYDSAQLEIVPPSEESSADSAYGAEDSVENSSASTSAAALQEELARKEEALITEQQTNEYLQQRIRELEARVSATDSAGIRVEDEELADMESRLREQREAAQPPPTAEIQASSVRPVQEEQPWYGRWTTWVIAALVLAAAGFGWFRSRRGAGTLDLSIATSNVEDDTVRGIKDDAEELLKVLKPVDQQGKAAAATGKTATGSSPQPVLDAPADLDGLDMDEAPAKPVRQFSAAKRVDHEEAYVLDEDSADPEVRLDLARAYISMGDREAARAILGEVVEHGDEAQQAEAKAMLGGL